MYTTRWATRDELSKLADYWFKMACEMGELDNIPMPGTERLAEVNRLFLKEYDADHLNFRVAIDEHGDIVACEGGLVRMEYSFPLSAEQTPFGWIVAVYTLEQHRNKGLAYQLVEEVCSWLKKKGASRARLWSSSSGRNVYERLVFKSMIDMEKSLL